MKPVAPVTSSFWGDEVGVEIMQSLLPWFLQASRHDSAVPSYWRRQWREASYDLSQPSSWSRALNAVAECVPSWRSPDAGARLTTTTIGPSQPRWRALLPGLDASRRQDPSGA